MLVAIYVDLDVGWTCIMAFERFILGWCSDYHRVGWKHNQLDTKNRVWHCRI
jgi:hypothetical protein